MSIKTYRKLAREEAKRLKKLANQKPKLPSDFHWRVARWVLNDTQCFLPPSAYRWLDHAITTRDATSYLSFCNAASLQSINRTEELSLWNIRALRMNCFLEKFLFPGDESIRDAKAIDKFLKAEAHCAKVNSGEFPIKNSTSDLFDEPIFEYARDFCKLVLSEDIDFGFIFHHARFGPGADSATVSSRTALFDKMQPPFTVTNEAETLFRHCIIDNPRWLRSLMSDYKRDLSLITVQDDSLDMNGYMGENSICQDIRWIYLDWSIEDREKFWSSLFVRTNCNEIRTVPKNATCSRDMAIEPSGNIYLQLGVDKFIKKKLLSMGIDLSTQKKNQELARIGSLNGSIATLDLSQASNLISLVAMEYLLPKNWNELLLALRCPEGHIKVKSTGTDTTIQYEKVASMGNGFTFALETLIFSSLVYGVVKYHDLRWRDVLPRIAIYGDDIAVPSDLEQDVMRVLVRAGFKVNAKKTFRFGRIRESCGKDFYCGEDIRGPHIEAVPETLADVVTTYNVIYDAYRRLFPGSLPLSLYKMRKWVPPELNFSGPEFSEEVGWFHEHIPTLPIAWSSDYQCFYRITHRLRKVRSPMPIPHDKRLYFGILQHTLAERPDSTYVDPSLVSSRRFEVLGRNCPITIKISRTWFVSHGPVNPPANVG